MKRSVTIDDRARSKRVLGSDSRREMAALISRKDWRATPLGPQDEWPQKLRSAVDLILPNDLPMVILWGADLIQIYNDAFRRIMGNKHPAGLGRPHRECWPEIWHSTRQVHARVASGETVTLDDAHYPVNRNGSMEDAWFTISSSPIRDEAGEVAGALTTLIETTERVQTEEALRRNEERFRAFVSAGNEIMYRMNRDWSELYPLDGRGFVSDSGASSKNWLESYIPPEEQPAVLAEIRRAIETRTPFSLELRVRRADGSIGWAASSAVPILDERGEIREWFGAAHDITPRRDAEDALRASEMRFRALVTASSQVLYRHNADWSELLQLSGGGFLADTESPDPHWFNAYILPEDQEQVWSAIQEAIRTKSIFELDHRVKLADGTEGWTKSRSVPLLDSEGEIIEWFGAASDITADRKAEEALRASEARYRTLFNSIDQGFCTIEMIYDEQGKPIDYVFLEANPAFVKQSGLVDPVGRRMRDMIPNHEQHWFDIYGRIARTGTPERFIERTEMLDRWLDLYAFRIGAPKEHRVAVLFSDISARRKAETALRESEERLRHVLESATEYAIIQLGPEGKIEGWNGGAERLLGYTEAEILGKDYAIFSTEDDIIAGQPAAKLRMAAREGRAESEHWHVRKDGSRFWGSGVMLPMEGKSGHFIKIFRDRTEERAAEERQKVLAGELNHRVKNTLTMVQAIASQTFRGSNVEKEVFERFTSRLRALASGHDILVAESWQGADLRDVIRSVLVPFCSNEERVLIEGPRTLLTPTAALSITMMLHELATNAVKYGALSNDTGQVEITWKIMGSRDDQQLQLRWKESGGPPVAPPTRKGFGSLLIERSLSGSTGGKTRVDYELTGVICTVRVPLAAVSEACQRQSEASQRSEHKVDA